MLLIPTGSIGNRSTPFFCLLCQILMILLQTTPQTNTDVIDRVMQITPAGLGGYGLALVVLVVGAYIFYRNWQLSDAENKLQAQKLLDFALNMSTLLTRVEVRLDDTKDGKEMKRDILRIVESTNKMVSDLSVKN